MTMGVLKMVVILLGVSLLICLCGIIWLASANPARPIPDVLIGTTGTIVGALGAILVKSPTQ